MMLKGIGTTYYGKRDFRPDKSYATTKWFVLFYVPIIPLGSFRVRDQGVETVNYRIFQFYQVRYEVLEKLRLNWKQVLYTYSFVCLCAFWVIQLYSSPGDKIARYLERSFSHPYRDYLIAALYMLGPFVPAVIPFILRYYAKRDMSNGTDPIQ